MNVGTRCNFGIKNRDSNYKSRYRSTGSTLEFSNGIGIDIKNLGIEIKIGFVKGKLKTKIWISVCCQIWSKIYFLGRLGLVHIAQTQFWTLRDFGFRDIEEPPWNPEGLFEAAFFDIFQIFARNTTTRTPPKHQIFLFYQPPSISRKRIILQSPKWGLGFINPP